MLQKQGLKATWGNHSQNNAGLYTGQKIVFFKMLPFSYFNKFATDSV